MLGKRLLLFVFLPIPTKNIDIGACVQKMLVASEYLSFLALLFFVLCICIQLFKMKKVPIP